jgi:hypothetical protein
MNCSITGCRAPARSRQLCATHYRRWLRTGDAASARKPGRPPDPYRTQLKALGNGDWSARTLATYITAVRLLHAWATPDECAAAITRATRENGTLNVTHLRREADAAIMRVVDDTGPCV